MLAPENMIKRFLAVGSCLFALIVACGGEDGGDGGDPENICEQGCTATLEADCDNGPASQSVCEADCEMLREGSCAAEYETLLSCAEGEEVTCDPQGIPVIEACAAEQTAFVDCLNS